MSDESTYLLQKKFKEAFPKEHELLSLAKTQDEIDELHIQFIDEARQKLNQSISAQGTSDQDTIDKVPVPADETDPVVLSGQLYDTLISSRKGEIKNQIHKIMDVLQRLTKLHNEEIGYAAAEMFGGGMLSIGMIASKAAFSEFIADVAGGETAAVLAGVTAMTVSVLVAVVTFLIFVILIPIIFYMNKPANCVILLINELSEDIKFIDQYNVHGKPKLMTTPLIKAISIPGYGTYPVSGFIACAKSSQALVGSQYGFTFETESGKRLSFGVECPLTSMYKDNNCYCEVGASAEDVAKKTDKHNKQEWHMTKNGITLEIRCNSGHGSTAYYIARVYKTPEV